MVNGNLLFVINALWFILPAYVANSSPTYFYKKFPRLHPIDFNRTFFDGREILGRGKTFEGFTIGTLCGIFMGYVQIILQNILDLPSVGIFEMTLKLAFVLSLGALLGDMIASFFKRRAGLKRGAKTPLLDTLDFLIGALVLASFTVEIEPATAIFLFIITPIIHRCANIFAFRRGMKDVPW